MARRKFRIVKITPKLAGVCEKCGTQFDSDLPDRTVAQSEIAAAFTAHKCLSVMDAAQNAVRVVHEATRDK